MNKSTEEQKTAIVRPKCGRCSGIGEIRNEIFMDDRYDEMMECPRCRGRDWSVEPWPEVRRQPENR